MPEEKEKDTKDLEARLKAYEEREAKLKEKEQLLSGLEAINVSKLEDLKSYISPPDYKKEEEKGSQEPSKKESPDLEERVARFERAEKEKKQREQVQKFREMVKGKIDKGSYKYLSTVADNVNVLDAILDECSIFYEKTGKSPKVEVILDEKEKAYSDYFDKQAEKLGYKREEVKDETKQDKEDTTETEEKTEEKEVKTEPDKPEFVKKTAAELKGMSRKEQMEYFYALEESKNPPKEVVKKEEPVKEEVKEESKKEEEPKRVATESTGNKEKASEQAEADLSPKELRFKKMRAAGFIVD